MPSASDFVVLVATHLQKKYPRLSFAVYGKGDDIVVIFSPAIGLSWSVDAAQLKLAGEIGMATANVLRTDSNCDVDKRRVHCKPVSRMTTVAGINGYQTGSEDGTLCGVEKAVENAPTKTVLQKAKEAKEKADSAPEKRTIRKLPGFS